MFFKEKYKNYVMHGGLNKMDKLKKALPFIIPPLAVLLIMGFAFYRHGLYPFGDGTVSWCDMSQQVIPLLTDFKDIFTGKDGMFLNFHNAGGMDLWGVFFFFIASPYTLLVLFVDKADIIYLVNILTVLKMMTAAVTAQIYFRSCQKKLDPYIGAVLSVIYAFCGYGMLYYQNNIWLDMMYLFPLLMVAFRELFEVNLVGSMGYNSLSHYTSLTSRDYMYMMKQLGYSSYWMEVGSYGGTELTDALLSVKYLIEKNTGSADAVYSNDTYEIVPTEYYLPLGIVTDADLSGSEELSTGTRSDVQKKLFEQLFGGNGDELITDYEYTTIYGVQDDSNFKPNYTLNTTGDVAYMDYSIDVTDKQTLYFDCFDKLSNSLSEDINGSFMVTVNGQVMQMDYPSQSSNGLLKLGEFENEHVNVRVTLKKDITNCRSYGVFGLHHNVLEKALEQAQTAGLTDSDGKLSGSVNAKAGQKCVLQIPYQEGLKIKVNGKAVSYDKVFGDLVSFDLQEGENTITVTSVPNGFYAGLALTIAGIALTAGYFFIRKKLKFGETLEAAALVAVIGAGTIVMIVVYVAPCILNIYS